MTATQEFTLVINAYSPERIPLSRLAAYMAPLAEILGEHHSVHFGELRKGSTKLAVQVEQEAVPKVKENIAQAGDAPKHDKRRKGVKEIDRLLRMDDADGYLESHEGRKVIRFPGKNAQVLGKIGPLKKTTQIAGTLVRIEGTDRTVHAGLQDQEGRTYKTVITKAFAKEIAPHLFSKPLRLSGEGSWIRDPDEGWKLDVLRATSFEVLEDRCLSDAVLQLREIANSKGNVVGQPDEMLERERA